MLVPRLVDCSSSFSNLIEASTSSGSAGCLLSSAIAVCMVQGGSNGVAGVSFRAGPEPTEVTCDEEGMPEGMGRDIEMGI